MIFTRLKIRAIAGVLCFWRSVTSAFVTTVKEKNALAPQSLCENITVSPTWERRVALHLASAVGTSFEDAMDTVRMCIEAKKKEIQAEGPKYVPPNWSTLLLEAERTNPTIKSKLAPLRRDGVTDDDIRRYHDMNEIERRTLQYLNEVTLYSAWKRAHETGVTDDRMAAVSARKQHPYYGDPDDMRVTSGDDRPLPFELMLREDVWSDEERNRNPSQFKESLEKFSSYNAFVRAEIRAGRL